MSRNSGVGMGVKSRGFGRGVVHALKYIATTAQPAVTKISVCGRFILTPDEPLFPSLSEQFVQSGHDDLAFLLERSHQSS